MIGLEPLSFGIRIVSLLTPLAVAVAAAWAGTTAGVWLLPRSLFLLQSALAGLAVAVGLLFWIRLQRARVAAKLIPLVLVVLVVSLVAGSILLHGGVPMGLVAYWLGASMATAENFASASYFLAGSVLGPLLVATVLAGAGCLASEVIARQAKE